MVKIKKYLAFGLVTLAAYAANIGWRMSNATNLSRQLGNTEVRIESAITKRCDSYNEMQQRMALIKSSSEQQKLANQYFDSVDESYKVQCNLWREKSNLERQITEQKRKAFLLL
jgi:hypothetical protein